MKKILFSTSLMFISLCFVGCQKSEPTDLRLFELKGNVESVSTFVTSNVNSKGKKTRKSYDWKEATYYFDKEGRIISGYDESLVNREILDISRNKAGNIDTIRLPFERAFDGYWYKSYKWNKNGFPIGEEYSSIGRSSDREILYNDSNQVVGKIERGWYEEGEQWEQVITFKILSEDAKGNWTKRLEILTDERNDLSFTLVERTITYYDGSISSHTSTSTYNDNTESCYDRNSSSEKKWEEFAGKTYRASQWVSDRMQYYAFSYNRSGKGKYFIYCNYPGTNVVEDQIEFSIYNVESEGNYLYLYSYELNSPVKIEIQGSSLYTMNGDRYEIWK